MSETLLIERVALVAVAIATVALLLRLIYYHAKLRAISRYHKEYEQFREAATSDPTNHNLYYAILEKQTEIVKLFKQARRTSPIISYAEQAGYGLVQSRQLSPWDNLQHDSAEIQQHILFSFHISIGYFRARRNETVSPVFWIESLIIWPRSLLGFLGYNNEGAFAKLLQILVLIFEIVVAAFAATNSIIA